MVFEMVPKATHKATTATTVPGFAKIITVWRTQFNKLVVILSS